MKNSNRGKRSQARRGLEIVLLLVVVALVAHTVRTRQQAEEIQERQAVQQAGEYYESLSPETKANVEMVAGAFLDGARHGPEFGDDHKARVAIHLANRELKLDPKNIEALSRRAGAYWQVGQYEEFLADIQTVLELDPSNEYALGSRGYYYAEMKDYSLAEVDYKKLLKLHPEEASLWNTHSYYLAKLGRFEEAMGEAEKADSLEPNNAATLDTLGYIQVGLGHYEEAVGSYSRAIELEINSLHALRGRAVAYRQLGQLELSQKDLDAVAQLDPSFCLHWETDPDPGEHGDQKTELVAVSPSGS